MKKTKFTTIGQNTKLNPFVLIFIIITIYIPFFIAPLVLLVYFLLNDPIQIITDIAYYDTNGEFSYTNLATFGILVFFWYMPLLITIFSHVGTLLGKIRNSIVNIFSKKPNPYLYFRELPNDFGIGITSLLFDSTLENEKDIVAVILDLCARGYLSLEKQNKKYTIKILNTDTSKLLNNEIYIFDLLVTNKLKEINYRKWYEYCLNDGINLELYTHKKNRNNITRKNYDNIGKVGMKITLVLYVLYLLFTIFSLIFFSPLTIRENLVVILLKLPVMLAYFLPTYFVVTILYNLFLIIAGIIKGIYQTIANAYSVEISNNLKRTKKGINELHKLEAFKSFIKDFGNFADKYPEEIVLWDRYLSYAQVFGLTKDIMKSGYSKLVKNSSFQIDSIDDITFDNIEIF